MFVIHRRPAIAGDLVVTGRVDSKLRSVGTVGIASAHRKLVFADDRGNPLVEYGAAIAYDAAGRRTEVATSFDGTRVQLTVSGNWLAGARYPVTIDPLTARVIVSTWGGATFGLSSYPEVGCDDENNQLMVFYARQFSATDFDGYARLTDSRVGRQRQLRQRRPGARQQLRLALVRGVPARWVHGRRSLRRAPGLHRRHRGGGHAQSGLLRRHLQPVGVPRVGVEPCQPRRDARPAHASALTADHSHCVRLSRGPAKLSGADARRSRRLAVVRVRAVA